MSYAKAVIRHATGDLPGALQEYKALLPNQIQEIRILSTLNSALIVAGPDKKDIRKAQDMLAKIEVAALAHKYPVIPSAFNIVKVAIMRNAGDNALTIQ